jgi:hypothetical protein
MQFPAVRQTLSSDFRPNPRILLFSLFLSPLVHRLSQRRKTEAKTKAMPNRYANLTPLFPIFNSSCPRKESNELKRDRQTSRNKYEVFALGSGFFQNRVFTLLSVSISPRTSPISGKKNPAKPKALPENRYTDPTTPLCSSILLAQGQNNSN